MGTRLRELTRGRRRPERGTTQPRIGTTYFTVHEHVQSAADDCIGAPFSLSHRLDPPENIDPSTNLARDNPAKTFTFDNVFDKKAVQVDVYNRVARCGLFAQYLKLNANNPELIYFPQPLNKADRAKCP